MRVAALYDIHGNLPALEAVLFEIAEIDVGRIIVGGDVIPGPMPSETIGRLRGLEVPVEFIMGNGELAVLAEADNRDSGVPAQYRDGIRWNAAQLPQSDRSQCANWPKTLRMNITGLGAVLFCHATPNNPHDIFTRTTPEEVVRSLLGEVDADVVVCGHTHMQFDRWIGRLRVVNAGSVGMPFGEPGAYWVLLGPGIEMRHTSYDLNKAASEIRHTCYPEAEAFAAQSILHPASEEKMLRVFDQTA